jgi:(R,R)-butanediol dehydrogenase/meso-butanediol dehydrogenase/diacetyl reductase
LVAALQLLEPRGRVVAVGLGRQPAPIDVRRLTLSELHLVGTNAHVFTADFADAARLIAARHDGWTDVAPVAIPLELLVTDALQPLAEHRSERIKTIIDPWAAELRHRPSSSP